MTEGAGQSRLLQLIIHVSRKESALIFWLRGQWSVIISLVRSV